MSQNIERHNVVTTAPPPEAVVTDDRVTTLDRVSPVVESSSSVRTASTRRFTPDAVIAAAVGVVLLVVGLIAVVRGGFDGAMSDPVVEVAGFAHTTTLGIIEIAFGLALLISGATSSRAGAMFFGGALGIAGFVGAVQTDSFDTSLGLESSFAWLMVLAGAIVVLAALLLPRYVTRDSSLHTDLDRVRGAG
jgi:uncharacterized membrane protein HdeD (DUF308 family)